MTTAIVRAPAERRSAHVPAPAANAFATLSRRALPVLAGVLVAIATAPVLVFTGLLVLPLLPALGFLWGSALAAAPSTCDDPHSGA